MENTGAASKGRIFISCKKQKHYSREVMLQQHALVHVFSGEFRIIYANQQHIFRTGDTVLIPRHQLGRLVKLPLDGVDFRSVSILFPEELLQKYYSSHPVHPSQQKWTGHLALHQHPLLNSLFNSLLPYFEMHEELPAELVDIKILETLSILQASNEQASQILSLFQEPGKVDLADFMEQHFTFNIPLEKFGYLTGRSLTTFKKDFKKIYRVTPGRWLTQKRLELAHYQIFVQKKKPSDVYVDVGFENLSHFSFAFKKQFGYSPANITGR